MTLALACPSALGLNWMQGLQQALDSRCFATSRADAAPTLSLASAEDEFIAAARAGSPQAFSRLVERHQQAVRGFLRRACGDAAVADDLAQETFLAAWSGFRAFDGRSSLRSWLCGIAYRKHLGDRRAVLRGMRRDRDWAEAQALTVRQASTSDDVMTLQDAMAALPIEQRAAVALCLAADFSHAEAAAALDLPLGTVKSHVSRGRARLLERLGGSRV